MEITEHDKLEGRIGHFEYFNYYIHGGTLAHVAFALKPKGLEAAKNTKDPYLNHKPVSYWDTVAVGLPHSKKSVSLSDFVCMTKAAVNVLVGKCPKFTTYYTLQNGLNYAFSSDSQTLAEHRAAALFEIRKKGQPIVDVIHKINEQAKP